MGTPHMQKSSAYMVRRTARQMRVKLTACLEAAQHNFNNYFVLPSLIQFLINLRNFNSIRKQENKKSKQKQEQQKLA